MGNGDGTALERIVVNGFTARAATSTQIPGARALMLRTFKEDFGYGVPADHHDDVSDLRGSYVDAPHARLFVAVDDASGEVIATAAVHPWERRHPLHPDWLHERYQTQRAAELTRVYTAREHRRRGAARALVELARRWVIADGTYVILMLHTNAGIPGAEPFWRSLATEVLDSRPTLRNTVHFELPLDRAIDVATAREGQDTDEPQSSSA